MANRAAEIRAAVLAAHAGAAAVVERGQRFIRHRLADTPDGRRRYVLDTSLGALHYADDQGAWQEIDDALVDDGAEGFTVKTAATPYLLRADGAGKRRLYPNRHDLTRYIELGGLPALGTHQRGPNYLLWDRPNFAVWIRTAPDTLKFVAVLKNANAPTSFAFTASLVGLTRQGQLLLADGVPIARIRKPSAVDAEGIEREATISFAGGKITVGLDTTGLVFPIELDPTVEVSVDASNNDYSDRGDVFSSTTTTLYLGNITAADQHWGCLFPLVTIPPGQTVSNCHITVVAASTMSTTTVNALIYGNDTATPTAPVNHTGFDALVLTGASVPWNAIGTWTIANLYDTPDISAIVQELLNSYDYSSGAHMQFILYNNASSLNARRSGSPWDHATYDPPLLHIEYNGGGGVAVAPAGIESAEAVGAASLVPGGVTLEPPGIASAEALGAPVAMYTLEPSGIASAEAVGTPAIALGGVILAAPGIASAEDLSSPAIVLTVSPAGIASAESLGTPALQLGGVSLQPAGIASVEAFGSLVVVPPAGAVDVQVAASSDDCFAYDTLLDLTAVFVLTQGGTYKESGARFLGVKIPWGAQISSAYITVSPTQYCTGPASARIAGQASDDTATFSTRGDFDDRPRTSSFVDWAIPIFYPPNEYQTPNLASVIQEIVSRPGWCYGNSLVLFVRGMSPTNIRYAYSYDGSPTVCPRLHIVYTMAPILAPAGIPSAEALGEPAIAVGGVTLLPSGIASEEALGTPVVSVGGAPQTVEPAGVVSAEALGTPSIAPGGVSILPAAIASEEALGGPATVATALPSGIASAEELGPPVIGLGGVALLPGGIASAEALGIADVSVGGAPQILEPAGVASAEVLGTPVIGLGAVTLQTPGVASEEALGMPTLVQTLVPAGIASAEALGVPAIALGGVNVSPPGIASSEALGQPSVYVGQVVLPPGIASSEALGAVAAVPGGITVSPPGIASTEEIGAAAAFAGDVDLGPPGIASSEALGKPTLVLGGLTLMPPGVASGEALGIPAAAPGGVVLSPPGIASGEALGQPTLLLFVSPAGVPSAEALGTPAIVLGGVTLLPMGIVSAEELGAVRVVANLIASEAQLLGEKQVEAQLLGGMQVEAQLLGEKETAVALGGKT